MNLYFVFEILGTLAFAISGAMVACEKKMDILGVVILGVTTSVGGGIMRDILIGVTPPSSLVNPIYAGIAIIVSLIVFLPRIRSRVNMESRVFIFIDALGLGTFTVIGCRTAIPFDNVWMQMFLGVLTGVGGGVMRDVFAAQRPFIFVKHFYACASLCGAVFFTVLLPYGENLAIIVPIVLVVVLRMLAAKYKWNLPRA